MTVDERLTEVFRTVFNDDSIELHDTTTSSDIDDWDSVANINLMFSLEQEFGVRFQDDQLSSFANVGALRRFLEAHAS
jgi:acyl carrier protein